MGIVRNHNRADIVCMVCGQIFTVPNYRREKAKYCGKKCSGAAHAEKFLNKGPKPWAAANLDGHRGKNKTSFKPGHKPWNDGLKGIHLSPDSEFKPGRMSENKLPIGSVTIRDDKQGNPRAWVKTVSGWDMRSRVVYAIKHGPIPNGFVVHHLDRNTLNDRPENLEALSRAEHIEAHRDDLLEARNA